MRDVAQAAGVSYFTVSKVLNHHPKVRPDTRAKVLRVCEELGYQRNPQALDLVRRKSTTIGMVVSQITNPFYGEILEAAEKKARALGYHLVYQCSYLDPAIESEIVRHFQALRVSGLIIAPVMTPDNRELLRQIEKTISVVYVDRFFEDDCHYIGNDNFDSGKRMTEHLLAQGRRPAYLGSLRSVQNGALRNREKGYLSAMEAASKIPQLIPTEFSIADRDNELFGYENIAALLKRKPAPEALFCANDAVAIGAMRAFHEKGLKVGEDILVAGHDNFPLSAYLTPPLTTMDQPKIAMGEGAVEAIVREYTRELNSPQEKVPYHQLLQSRLCVRESTVSGSLRI
jgi:DNA-binding LacI/PurR family transcriptional regulator